MSSDRSARLDFALGIDPNDMGAGSSDYGLMLPEYDHPAEVRRRGGIPNALHKLELGRKVTIGYIGGSITLQEGWRPRTTEWLKSHFPKAAVHEVNAAVNGTGADFGAARIEQHLLNQAPDLIFIEFVVNGGNPQHIEGMVRKIWRNNPDTDICFVYTLLSDHIPSYRPGSEPIFPATLQAFETIGAYYDIPSVYLGYVLGDLYAKNMLAPKANELIDAAGKIAFSKDGVHPVGIGDQLYAGAVARSIRRMQKDGKPPAPHALKAPLNANHWEHATMCDAALFSVSLEAVDTQAPDFHAKFPYTGYNLGVIRSMFPSLVKMAKPGDSLTVHFKGTTIGIADAGGPFSGQLSVTIDGKAAVTVNRFTGFNANLRHQIFYLPEMEDAEHTVIFTLMSEIADKRSIVLNKAAYDDNPDAYKGNEVYIGKILVVGQFLRQ